MAMLILAWVPVIKFGTQFSDIKQNNINILLTQQSHVGRAFSSMTQARKRCKTTIYVRIKTKRINHFAAVKNAGRRGRGRGEVELEGKPVGRGAGHPHFCRILFSPPPLPKGFPLEHPSAVAVRKHKSDEKTTIFFTSTKHILSD